MKISSRLRMSKKGIATWIAQTLVGLFAVGCVAILYFFIFTRYFDVQFMVIGNEAKRHTINIAQVLASSDKLVYEESFSDGTKRFNRAIFDKNKLDEQMVNSEYFNNYNLVTKDSEISEELGYPNTTIDIIVYDSYTASRWVLSIIGPGIGDRDELSTCLSNKINSNFFSQGLPDIFTLWEWWQTEQCFDKYEPKVGTYQKNFPALIKDEEGSHAGHLLVRLTEI